MGYRKRKKSAEEYRSQQNSKIYRKILKEEEKNQQLYDCKCSHKNSNQKKKIIKNKEEEEKKKNLKKFKKSELIEKRKKNLISELEKKLPEDIFRKINSYIENTNELTQLNNKSRYIEVYTMQRIGNHIFETFTIYDKKKYKNRYSISNSDYKIFKKFIKSDPISRTHDRLHAQKIIVK